MPSAPSFELAAHAQAARERLLGRLQANPFAAPIDPRSWDYGQLIDRSDALQELFAADLQTLAAEGDMASLREFMRAPWLDPVQRHRIQGDWMQEIFRLARLDILPTLIDEWAAPNAIGPGPVIDRPIHSETWTESVGVALGRAHGDARILEAAWRYLPLIVNTNGQEHLSDLIDESVPQIAPDDFSLVLAKTLSLIRERGELSETVFASRAGYRLRTAFPASPHIIMPIPEPTGEETELARRYLNWLLTADLSLDSHPASARLLGVSASFARIPELASELASLYKKHGWLHGSPIEPDGPRDLEALDPERQCRPCLYWRAERLSPVDQALLWRSLDGAKALIRAGFKWSPTPFIESCQHSMSHPETSEPEAGALAYPLALAERLALADAASAPSAAGPAHRI